MLSFRSPWAGQEARGFRVVARIHSLRDVKIVLSPAAAAMEDDAKSGSMVKVIAADFPRVH
jgi:hypothetical protein